MKKTYVKITSLICVLILAVMMLGCALFTYVQIGMVNKKCMAEIHNCMQILPNEYNANEESVGDYLVYQKGTKFLASLGNPDIGYYGETSWKWANADFTHTMETSRFTYIDAFVNKSKDGWNITMVQPSDGKATASVDFETSGNGRIVKGVTFADDSKKFTIIYAKDIAVISSSASIVFSDGDEGDQSNEKAAAQKVRQIDAEAEKKYTELMGSDSSGKKNLSETGWLTSYVVYSANTKLMDGEINVNECDLYLYHPLSIVFSNYMYVYIMFIAVLLVMLFFTIFTMRRMYINRMSFEARSKNLTRSFAHELKTPLAVTKSYVENWDIVDEKERPEVAAKINTEVDHMTKMVNTLLDLSKMESGDMKLDLEEVELFDLSKACFKHVESLAKERNLTVEFKKDKEDGEYTVSADLDLMRMVISNFLSNAIKYGKEKVTVSLATSGGNAVFRITNDGEIISKKDQKKIWDLFYKKDKSGSDRLGSNGVGLAVNKSILELHKAKFGVESSPMGNTFWFEMKKAKE